MLENKTEKEKKVSLKFDCNGYTSLNEYTYSSVLKAKETKYLFCFAQDIYNPDVDNTKISFNFNMIVN